MIEISTIRARLQELERFDMKWAPAPVRERAATDTAVFKELLTIRETGEGKDNGSGSTVR